LRAEISKVINKALIKYQILNKYPKIEAVYNEQKYLVPIHIHN